MKDSLIVISRLTQHWNHSKRVARNEMEGGFTKRRVVYTSCLIEPQGKLEKRKLETNTVNALIIPSTKAKATEL